MCVGIGVTCAWRGVGTSCCSMFYMDSRQLRLGGGGEPVAASMELNGVRVSGKESSREMKRDRDRQRWRERKGEARLPLSPPFLPCSEQEEEDPATQAEEEHLQGAVYPEEFVAIADYSATDETQVAMWVYSLWAQHVQWQD